MSQTNTNSTRAKLDAIIDGEIRPMLSMHGGDLDIVNFEKNVLTIKYQGACGGCPSAALGTRQMIESVLQEKLDPKITVKLG